MKDAELVQEMEAKEREAQKELERVKNDKKSLEVRLEAIEQNIVEMRKNLERESELLQKELAIQRQQLEYEAQQQEAKFNEERARQKSKRRLLLKPERPNFEKRKRKERRKSGLKSKPSYSKNRNERKLKYKNNYIWQKCRDRINCVKLSNREKGRLNANFKIFFGSKKRRESVNDRTPPVTKRWRKNGNGRDSELENRRGNSKWRVKPLCP